MAFLFAVGSVADIAQLRGEPAGVESVARSFA